MLKQRTLRESVSTVGIGLHSGRRIHLVMKPAAAGTGIVFRRTDLTPAVDIPAVATNVNDTRLATTVNVGQARVSTIEHLMSAFNGLGIDNCLVEVDAPEIPVMDGSAASFVFLIHAAGIVEQNAPKQFVRVLKTVEVKEEGKWARLEPHFGFSLEFSIDFHHPAIDSTIQSTKVDCAHDSSEKEVARSRTFGFVNDVEFLRSIGLAQGGSLDNAVVMDDYRVLNNDGLRSRDEFVKHKILDAMGDLYVLGHPMLAAYSACKSGHALNNKLLRALLADASAWEIVTFSEAEKAPADFAFRPNLAIV